MDTLAKLLVALSYKGTWIASVIIFGLLLAAGLHWNMWIFYVPVGLFGLTLVYDLGAFIVSAVQIGADNTIAKLKTEVQKAQEEIADSKVAAEARREARLDELRQQLRNGAETNRRLAEKLEKSDSDDPQKPRLHVVNGNDK